ncbi:MAG: hypothetical protein HYV09_06425 [Deltaproteobacteria bacterium]|nr:hypothetical protein [Deltaproteobacteria bacterium]
MWGSWFAYGLGASVGRALLRGERARRNAGGPVRQGTEEDFRKDEERFAEDQRRIEASGDDRPSGAEG